MTPHHLSSALIESPLWTPDTLGKPIPDSPFAVSVSLPTWDDVIGYEERDSRVVDAMLTGYPRFFINPVVARLSQATLATHGDPTTEGCLLFPTEAAANRCVRFIRATAQIESHVRAIGHGSYFAVFHPHAAMNAAKSFWQHCGEGMSAREAVAIETGTMISELHLDARGEIIDRLGAIYDVPSDAVHLFPTGMAAIWASFRALTTRAKGAATVQFGFPYVDTLKLHETAVDAHQFLPMGDAADLGQLRKVLSAQPVAGVYCEVPSNPLLRTPDLHALRSMTHQHGAPLIVDDTLVAFYNLEVLPHCDMVACSLTKYFSGVGDVMGGALIVNPKSAIASELTALLQRDGAAHVYTEDLLVLAERSRSVEPRVRAINARAEELAEFLADHPRIATLNYPSRNDSNYGELMRPGGGLGGLLSFTLTDPKRAKAVYDSLPFCKGPNLGMEYTLCCPFTVLAHYDELAFAERCGLQADLIRVSVGTEDSKTLIDGFAQALARA